jgi:CBS-domain-containing membrane protein
MNIAFFLTPKSEVVWLPLDSTLDAALTRLEKARYSAVPLLDAEQKYVGTLTVGDLLWYMKEHGLRFADCAHVHLDAVPRHVVHQSVSIDAEIEDLFSLAAGQNFVPVHDDRGIFIGIVRRKVIIDFCVRELSRSRANPARE